ncbi:glycosyltransferase family 2 protein [Weissella confusa]|uniref:glycosyltransferase family 2 protein n=1 Tax=Weissella confusa TaxID=1583 RepID=UPI0018F25D8E|nr:glycosyltransferase family 2 protein [Weissella confusa]MBJ7647622.1 glycosyltransferase family 2 protein [Weissella confusa]MBJ7680322.1 glycosyltransferase family 2 protein [Weissella confusa]
MYKEPLVTVAVLSHNLEGYIGHSLKTVNKQTYKNMDIVILDDASSDDTMSEINHWAARDDRMRVIKNNKRKGVAAVRNQALNQIRGKYFIFVDGDDQLAPAFVETLVGALEENPDISIASVGFSWGASGAPKKAHEVKFRKIDRAGMFEGVTHRGHVISGMVWNKIYRSADLLDSKVRFDETLELAEDHLWIAQVVASKAMSEYSLFATDVLYNKVSRSTSIIHTASHALREREREIDQQIARIGDDII